MNKSITLNNVSKDTLTQAIKILEDFNSIIEDDILDIEVSLTEEDICFDIVNITSKEEEPISEDVDLEELFSILSDLYLNKGIDYTFNYIDKNKEFIIKVTEDINAIEHLKKTIIIANSVTRGKLGLEEKH